MKNNSCSLIIGSNGFIGTSLALKLSNQNDLYTISRSNQNPHIHSRHFELNIQDIDSFKTIISKLSSKYKKIFIYYLVGPISGNDSIKNPVEVSLKHPKEVLEKSIANFINIIDTLRGINCTIVFASTGAIYDSRAINYFTEGDKLFPPSPYAAIKYASEGIAMSYFESFKLDIRIARIFSVYGEDMDRFFIFDIVKKLLLSESEIRLKGSGVQERDYLHVDDVSNGLVIIARNGNPGEFYNICSGTPVKISELANDIKDILQLKNKDIIWDQEQTEGIRDIWYGNNKKILDIGFQPSIDKSKLNSTVQSIKLRLIEQNLRTT